MRLRYTRRARQQIDHIHDYIAARDAAAAMRVVGRIREITELLRDFPLIGHPGMVATTREFGVPGLPYVVVHRIDRRGGDTLVILGVFHTAQDRTRG